MSKTPLLIDIYPVENGFIVSENKCISGIMGRKWVATDAWSLSNLIRELYGPASPDDPLPPYSHD